MKELSIEEKEKAKRYDEALGKAKKELDTCGSQDCDAARQIFRFFPELKESEDEKIRKTLKSFFDSEISDYGNVEWRNGIKYGEIVAWLEKQGEHKPTDKVEQKFKVGDWITNSKLLVGQVTSFDGEYYHYMCNGIEQPLHVSNAYNWHIWTIQDAKDGNVLVTHLNPEGDWIGIYKESVDILGFKTYCFLNGIGEFVINPNRCRNHGTHGLHPATKEQRDLLFSKMKEAGYEWDEEKKVLKKIEQKLICGKDDSVKLNDIVRIVENSGNVESIIEHYTK